MQTKNRHQQTGGMLIETVAGVAILGAVAIGAANLIEQSASESRAATAAQQLKTVGDAAAAYIRNHYKDITLIATDTKPVLITVQDLINENLLPAGFSQSNTFQQNTCVLALEQHDAAGNSTGKLNALVVTEGGTALDEVTQATIANMAGANAGRIIKSPATTPERIQGTRGAWTMNNANLGIYSNGNLRLTGLAAMKCDSSPGTAAVPITAGRLAMALWLGNANGGINQDVLYRVEIPGHDELNDMNTTLGVTKVGTGENSALRVDKGNVKVATGDVKVAVGNVNVGGDITVTGHAEVDQYLKAKTLEPTDSTASQGSSCTAIPSGTLATDILGKLYSCIGSVWQRVGGETRKYQTYHDGPKLGQADALCATSGLSGAKLVSGACYSTVNGSTSWSTNGYPVGDTWHCPAITNSPLSSEVNVPLPTGNTTITVTNTVLPALTTAYAICEIPQ